MMIPTHRLVGKYVYSMLCQKNKEKIHYRRFVWGNMKPDMLPMYKRVSHYYPANEAFVFNLLDKVYEEPLTVRDYSDLLGVLIHFLCDYTCIYHNNMTINEANTMKQHMYYEWLLHWYSRRKIKKCCPKMIEFACLEDVKYHIYQVIRRANLAEMVPDMKADFKDMMEMSVSVVHFLLKNR